MTLRISEQGPVQNQNKYMKEDWKKIDEMEIARERRREELMEEREAREFEPFTMRERLGLIWQALKAGLLIGGVYIVVFGLVILLMVIAWTCLVQKNI